MGGFQPGDVIAGKYAVENVIGSGGMGYVVLATHPILGACAIKLLHPDYAKNAEVVARFVREAQAIQRIQNEHVVRVSDVGVDQATGCPYIVMERLLGQDLQHLLEAHRQLPVEHSVEYILQACEALAEAHVEGIVHRDLKPANLFVTTRRDGTAFVKVLDFGISKMAASAASGPGGESNLTKTSGIMGTVLYMSPEQLQRPKEVDARSDVWALGVILYQLLSGNLPFVGDDMPNTVVKVIMEEPVPLARLRPDVPQALLAVVDRCLRKSRDERFPHIAAFAAALQDVANATGRAAIEKILRVSQHAGQAPPSAPLLPLTQQPAVKELASPPGFLGAGTTNGEAVSVMAGSDATTAILPKRSVTPLVIAGVAVVIGLLGGIAAYALNSGGPTVTTASGSNEATTEKKKAEPAPSAEAAQATASMAASPSSAPTTSASPSTPSTAPKPTAPAGLAITVPPGTSKSDPKAKASSTPSATPPPPPVVTEVPPPVVTPPPVPSKPAKNTNVYEE